MTATIEKTKAQALPSRKLLRLLLVIGWLMIVGAICLAIYSVWNDYKFPEYVRSYGSRIKVTTGIQWYHIAPLLVGGIVIVRYYRPKYTKYFTTVRSGVVVGLDTTGGGHSSLSWEICLRGKTLSGETLDQWIPVSAGQWRDIKIGDRFKR